MDQDAQQKGHSEEWFGDFRNFWYNHDFLELMARRWKLDSVDSLLDVGCGQCHWSRLLSDFMKPGSQITCVDKDVKWAAHDAFVSDEFSGKSIKMSQSKADVYDLPFSDNSFDVVTCQTLLIHVDDPIRGIREMIRVLKPGGIMICAEPNNISQMLLKDSLTDSDSIEDTLKDIQAALILERGKKKAGMGDNSLGDLLPGLFNEAGLDAIQCFLSDKCNTMVPPYNTPEMKTMATHASNENEFKSVIEDERKFYISHVIDTGWEEIYEDMERRELLCKERELEAMRAGIFHSAGGAVMYLVSGLKPQGT